MNPNPERLLEAAGFGDSAAKDTLIARHLPSLRAFIRLRMGAVIRAKESQSDLVQSVCREVIENIGRLDYQGEAAFRQWLFTTALRKLTERQRYYLAEKRDAAREAQKGGAGSTTDIDLAHCYGTMITPSRIAMAKEDLARFEEAFDGLPENYREAFLLKRILGLSHAEIAARMNLTESAVKQIVYRARARLGMELRKRE